MSLITDPELSIVCVQIVQGESELDTVEVTIGAHVVGFFPLAWAEHLSLALPVPYLCNKTLKILDTHLFHTLGL